VEFACCRGVLLRELLMALCADDESHLQVSCRERGMRNLCAGGDGFV